MDDLIWFFASDRTILSILNAKITTWYFMVIKIKSQIGKTWDICPTITELTTALNYHCHNYGEYIVNDCQLKSRILIDADLLRVTGKNSSNIFHICLTIRTSAPTNKTLIRQTPSPMARLS
ncbi:MAG: hypothetical protein KKA35_11210 [Proteobacteria bacterium]|nr:hypothetical protein [Pseudomonadota bacterium]